MSFTITAELPLGTYRGAEADGRAERMPSVARLHSALLAAAGVGPRAQPRDTLLQPCEADEAALRWLENNPPDAVTIPQLHVNRSDVLAYRNDGTIKKSRAVLSVKSQPKDPAASVAVAGRFCWTWEDNPPPEVAAALEALCPDVPHLGTTESPVRLRTSTATHPPTHLLDPEASLFGPPGQDVALPLPGRLEELVAAHQATYGRPPSTRQDRYGTDERSSSAVPPRHAVAIARYAAADTPTVVVPWTQALLLPLDRVVFERDRVAVAVAAHRALIATIGHGAPPLITGAYPQGVVRPANRLALQLLGPEMPVAWPASWPAVTGSVLALLLPRTATAGDLAVLAQAVADLPTFRGPGGRVFRVVGTPTATGGHELWRAPAPGMVRSWTTAPPAVPDVRGVGGGEWTFADAARLSVAFVWKDHLPVASGSRDQRYLAMAAAVAAAGVEVEAAAPLRTSDVGPYVHRVHEHAVVRPYRARLSLGALGDARTVQAIGQTRHLGGGLLVPLDVSATS